jgi:hypothetical protein
MGDTGRETDGAERQRLTVSRQAKVARPKGVYPRGRETARTTARGDRRLRGSTRKGDRRRRLTGSFTLERIKRGTRRLRD